MFLFLQFCYRFDHFFGQPVIPVNVMISHAIFTPIVCSARLIVCLFWPQSSSVPDCVFFLTAIGLWCTRRSCQKMLIQSSGAPMAGTCRGAEVQRCSAHAWTAESEEWCLRRTQLPVREGRGLLRWLRESQAMWLGLRRHLDIQEATFVLKVLAEHSGCFCYAVRLCPQKSQRYFCSKKSIFHNFVVHDDVAASGCYHNTTYICCTSSLRWKWHN